MDMQFPTQEEAAGFLAGLATGLNDGQYSDDLVQIASLVIKTVRMDDFGNAYRVNIDTVRQVVKDWQES